MRFLAFAAVGVALGGVAIAPVNSATAQQEQRGATATEHRVPVGTVSLYARSIGTGQPVIVLHGGPDFDHGYFLPAMDAFQDAFRLIYYDQRGRGKSADGVRPEDVSLASDLDDLDKVRESFRLDAPVLLGHSWGAVLALEYALRHPTRVSHLILMNPAPVSASEIPGFRKYYTEKVGADMERQRQIVASAAYREGDPEAVIARYRIHFKPALTRAEDYERLMAAMRTAFFQQGKEGIVKARAVEDRLMRDTWQVPGYDLLPKLRALNIPTLVIVGEDDFLPVAVGQNIAQAIPNARLVTIKACGHFSYLECPADVRQAMSAFFGRASSKYDGLIGTWRLVSASSTTANGTRNDAPYGPNPTGQLIYTRDGRMSGIISHGGRRPLSRGDATTAPADERAKAFSTFLAYAGRYSVRGDTVIHHVDIAWAENWVNRELVRLMKLEGDRLTLRTPPISLGGVTQAAELIWERVKD